MKFGKSVFSIVSMALFCSSLQSFAGPGMDDLVNQFAARIKAADSNISDEDAKSKASDQAQAFVSGDQKPELFTENVDGSLWPRFKIFEIVKSTPIQAAAVFTDYANHKKYFKGQGMTQSDVTSGAGTAQQVITYHVDFPYHFGSDDYSCKDTASVGPTVGSFQVSWDVLTSTKSYTKASPTPDKQLVSNGNVIFEPYGDDGSLTLIAYTNLIVPIDGAFVSWGLTITHAEVAAKDTVDALDKTIQSMDPAIMAQKISTLKTSLKLQ